GMIDVINWVLGPDRASKPRCRRVQALLDTGRDKDLLDLEGRPATTTRGQERRCGSDESTDFAEERGGGTLAKELGKMHTDMPKMVVQRTAASIVKAVAHNGWLREFLEKAKRDNYMRQFWQLARMAAVAAKGHQRGWDVERETAENDFLQARLRETWYWVQGNKQDGTRMLPEDSVALLVTLFEECKRYLEN